MKPNQPAKQTKKPKPTPAAKTKKAMKVGIRQVEAGLGGVRSRVNVI